MKKTKYIEVGKQFEDASKYGIFQLMLLTVLMAGLAGSDGWFFSHIWSKMGENTGMIMKTLVIVFYGVPIIASVLVLIACLVGFWFKVSPRTKVAKVAKTVSVEQALTSGKA